MKLKRKLLIIISFLLISIPNTAFAYSSKVILGGNNIGISVNTSNIAIVGFYKVNGKYIAKEAGFEVGDRISKINNENVSSINEIINYIDKDKNNIVVTVKRNEKELNVPLKVERDSSGGYKTGIYLKDSITGIGTLTYIDPANNIFGALGHEILESGSGKIVSIKDGTIFESQVTGTIKSSSTTTGEKNARFNSNNVLGSIKENTINGIFGKYNISYDTTNLIEVANEDEITLGKAYIYTVLKDNDIEKYEINILKINENSSTKNILFEITDKNLIEKTNGVIKGMSGSPIVQNDKLIGAVTHAIVNDNNKGYGIFITSMLEEGEN